MASTAFIGGGVMAEAMLSRALAAGVADAANVCVAEPIAERRAYIATAYQVATTPRNSEAARGKELVVLAVKPQHFGHVAEELRGELGSGQTVLSIIAGMPIRRIADGLGHPDVVRVMPKARRPRSAPAYPSGPRPPRSATTR